MKKNGIHKFKKYSIGLGDKFLKYFFKYPEMSGPIVTRNFKSGSNVGMGGRVKQLHKRNLVGKVFSLPNSNRNQSIREYENKILKYKMLTQSTYESTYKIPMHSKIHKTVRQWSDCFQFTAIIKPSVV